MTYRVLYTQTAKSDLEEIRLHLSEAASETLAVLLVERILHAVETLAELPLRHEHADEIGPRIHVMPVSSWRVWYTVDDDVVAIQRVLHRRRRIFRHMVEVRQ